MLPWTRKASPRSPSRRHAWAFAFPGCAAMLFAKSIAAQPGKANAQAWRRLGLRGDAFRVHGSIVRRCAQRANQGVPEAGRRKSLDSGRQDKCGIKRPLLDASPVAVGLGDDLEQVAARVLEVDAATAEVAVDLALLLLPRVRPVLELLLL